MNSRETLSAKLKEVLGSDKVYFVAPTKMSYPCIKYDLDNVQVLRFDNKRLLNTKRYTVTHIYELPKGEMIDKMLSSFMYISYDRQFISDGLFHDVYTVYW